MGMYPATDKRLYFIDNLRAFIILLVVVFHVAMGYTTWNLEWWYVNDIQKSPFFDLFILATDVYIMPIMFLIAGYFAAAVLRKKGTALFWRDKVRRIVIPWVLGVGLIAPLIAYAAIFSRTDSPPNYFAFWGGDFFGRYYQQAHYWFLGILALFFALLTIVYTVKPAYFGRPSAAGLPSGRFFLAFVLLSATPFFLANLFFWSDLWLNWHYVFMIQPVRIGLYICYFAMGVHAWKNAWFTAGGYRPNLRKWGTAAIVMLVVFLAYRVAFTLPANIPALFKAGHALAYAAFCLTAAMAFIALFAKYVDSNAYLWRRLAANSYTIYFVHQCVIIPLAYLVRKMPINIWLKYCAVSACAVILCFVIAEYLIGPILARGISNRLPGSPAGGQ